MPAGHKARLPKSDCMTELLFAGRLAASARQQQLESQAWVRGRLRARSQPTTCPGRQTSQQPGGASLTAWAMEAARNRQTGRCACSQTADESARQADSQSILSLLSQSFLPPILPTFLQKNIKNTKEKPTFLQKKLKNTKQSQRFCRKASKTLRKTNSSAEKLQKQ